MKSECTSIVESIRNVHELAYCVSVAIHRNAFKLHSLALVESYCSSLIVLGPSLIRIYLHSGVHTEMYMNCHTAIVGLHGDRLELPSNSIP